MGGSSKKVTVGYKYYLGMHMILCHGPIDKLTRIQVDERAAWSGDSTGGRINVSADNLFGGEKREGGISGAVDLEIGSPTQVKNDYLTSKIGSMIPAFRGVCGVVLRQCYLGINPYLKRWSFRIQRVFLRSGGQEQWYPEKAGIGQGPGTFLAVASPGWKYNVAESDADIEFASPAFDDSTWGVGQLPFASSEFSYFSIQAHLAGFTAGRNANWPAGKFLWLRKDLGAFPRGPRYYLETYVDNLVSVWLNGVKLATKMGISDHVPGVGTWLNSIHLPETLLSPSGPNLVVLQTEDTSGTSGSCYVDCRVVTIDSFDMNPAHIIRECLTDLDWGMGYQESDIDDASFTAAANGLYDEQMGISLLWDKQTPIEDFVSEIVRHINASLYVDRTTGLFVLKLIRNDFDEEDLITLGEGEIERVDGYMRSAFGDLVNSITVNFWDSTTGKTASVTAQDTALVQIQGSGIGPTLQYPGFTSRNIAARVAMRNLQALSTPLLSCTIQANRAAAGLNIGDPFKFEWPDYHDGYIVMRVTGVALGDGRRNSVRITCMQDVFSLPETAAIADPEDSWIDVSRPPQAALHRIVRELPYYELVQRIGQANADEQLVLNPELGFVIASAARPDGAINATMSVDAGAGYEDAASIDFCPFALLAAPAGPLDTVLQIKEGIDFDLIQVGTHIEVGEELVRVDVVDLGAGTITVGRGVLDTVPSDHAADTPLFAWDQYADGDTTEYSQGETINVKLRPMSGAGQVLLSQAAADEVTFDQRALRPYPPGRLRINTLSYPSDLTEATSITLSWAHRDRLQQTSGSLVDTEAGSIGPESGTTYTARIINASTEDVLFEQAGITGTSYGPLPLTGNYLLRAEVISIRDGLESWQRLQHGFVYGYLQYLNTESSDRLVSEAGDNLIME